MVEVVGVRFREAGHIIMRKYSLNLNSQNN